MKDENFPSSGFRFLCRRSFNDVLWSMDTLHTIRSFKTVNKCLQTIWQTFICWFSITVIEYLYSFVKPILLKMSSDILTYASFKITFSGESREFSALILVFSDHQLVSVYPVLHVKHLYRLMAEKCFRLFMLPLDFISITSHFCWSNTFLSWGIWQCVSNFRTSICMTPGRWKKRGCKQLCWHFQF